MQSCRQELSPRTHRESETTGGAWTCHMACIVVATKRTIREYRYSITLSKLVLNFPEHFLFFFFSTEYIGCFKDGNPRDLPQKVHNQEISSESCIKQCKGLKFKFAGLQFAYLCFCGNSFGRYGQVPEGKCSSSCISKKDSYCGGEWSSSIYRTGLQP